jgi:hypothetical protein
MKTSGFLAILLICQFLASCEARKTSTFEYYSDGTIKSETRPLNDSIAIFLKYYKNGKIRDSMTVLNGYLSGPATHFYENGKLRQRWIWKDGLPNGPSTTFYESGNVMDVLSYRDSIPVGNFVKYFDSPDKRIMYSANNVSVNGKKWVNWYVRYDSSGKVIGSSPAIGRILASNHVQLGDSLKITFEIRHPEYQKTKVYFGDYDDKFRLRDTSSLKGAYGTKDQISIFAPASTLGKHSIRGVLENYKVLDSLKSGLTKTEGKMIYWRYDYEVLPRN